LADARPTRHDECCDGPATVEVRRAAAVGALHNLWLRWKADIAEVSGQGLPLPEELQACQQVHEHWVVTLGAPLDFDRSLQDFFLRAGHVIFASPDPPAAMRVFWEGAPHRGRRAETNADRDLDLAIAVQKRVNDGASIEAASDAVGKSGPPYLSGEAVRKVYNRWRLEARATLALQAPEDIWRRGSE
jgi:hypothetical protein